MSEVCVTFIDADGFRLPVGLEPGESVMLAAARMRLGAIPAECGGEAQCGTCHVWLSEEGFARFAPPSRAEQLLLAIARHRRPTSRLSCQLRPDADLEVWLVPEQL